MRSYSDRFQRASLATRIRAAVASLGGIPAAAAQLGYGKATIYNYVNGTTAPPVDFLYALCGLSQCSPEWLFFGESFVPNTQKDSRGFWSRLISGGAQQ